METKIAQHKELFSYFHHMVMGSTDKEVKYGKPNPDIFLVAAARFPDKPKPEKVCSEYLLFDLVLLLFSTLDCSRNGNQSLREKST